MGSCVVIENRKDNRNSKPNRRQGKSEWQVRVKTKRKKRKEGSSQMHS